MDDSAGADLLVIGRGAAGMAAARTGVRHGRRTVLVQDGPVGGDTFTGCVPSKTLIAAAAVGAPFAAAMSRVRATISRIAATETADVLRGEASTSCRAGRGSPAPAPQVAGRRLTAARVVLGTDTAPLVPPLDGLADTPRRLAQTVRTYPTYATGVGTAAALFFTTLEGRTARAARAGTDPGVRQPPSARAELPEGSLP